MPCRKLAVNGLNIHIEEQGEGPSRPFRPRISGDLLRMETPGCGAGSSGLSRCCT